MSTHGGESHLEDPGVRLREATGFGGHDDVEKARQARRRETRSLDAVVAVGHDREAVAAGETAQRRAAAGQQVAALREVGQEQAGERRGAAGIGPDRTQQQAEALDRERRCRDLAPPVLLPQIVVDRAEGSKGRRPEGKRELRERLTEREPLRPVEVEEGVVGVEEDGAEAQGGNSYLAR